MRSSGGSKAHTDGTATTLECRNVVGCCLIDSYLLELLKYLYITTIPNNFIAKKKKPIPSVSYSRKNTTRVLLDRFKTIIDNIHAFLKQKMVEFLISKKPLEFYFKNHVYIKIILTKFPIKNIVPVHCCI